MHPSSSPASTPPDAISTCTRRLRSNTPLQALNLLNDAAWMEFSRAHAQRVLKEAPVDDRKRLTYAFRLVTSRMPEKDETEILASLLDQHRADFRNHPKDADAIVTDSKQQGLTTEELAAWTMVSRAILNLDEAITRE